jgi:hypothetical protein
MMGVGGEELRAFALGLGEEDVRRVLIYASTVTSTVGPTSASSHLEGALDVTMA